MIFYVKELLDAITTPLYIARGRRPWSLGYYTAKKNAICKAIDNGVFLSENELNFGYGKRIDERVVEYPWIFSQMPKEQCKVLDVGSALNHNFLLRRSPLKDAQLTIMTLAPERRCFWNRSISYVYGDVREQYFSDAIFDVVVSVSTIEHIGLDNTMLYTNEQNKCESDFLGFVPAVLEFRRVLKQNGTCLITVPFGRRGIHGWYQIFDQPLVNKIIETFRPSTFHIEYFGYNSEGWKRSDPASLENAEFFDIHKDKSFDTDFAAAARGVACIKLVV